MRKLEAGGRLDRQLEMLPSDAVIADRQRAGQGLTRPEAAVLMAYAKMTLYEDLLRTDVPDRDYLAHEIAEYFPEELRRRYLTEIGGHRLRREIAATWLANSIVNRGLDTLVSDIEDETGADLADISLAFLVARDAFVLTPQWAAIEALPADVPAAVQIELLAVTREVLVRGTRWFLAHGGRPLRIGRNVERFRSGIVGLAQQFESVVTEGHAAEIGATAAAYSEAGVPPDLARVMARLPLALAACDIVAITEPESPGGAPVEQRLAATARVYFALDEALGLRWFRSRIEEAPRIGRWDRLVLTGLEDDLAGILRALSSRAMAAGAVADDVGGTGEQVRAWLDGAGRGLARYRGLVRELEAAPDHDLAMLTVAMRTLGDLQLGR